MGTLFELNLNPSELGWVCAGLGMVTEIALPAGADSGNTLEEGRKSLAERGLARQEKEGQWVVDELIAGLAYGLGAPSAVWMLDILNEKGRSQAGLYDLKGVHVVVEAEQDDFRFVFIENRSDALQWKFDGFRFEGKDSRSFSLPSDSILSLASLARRDSLAAAAAFCNAGLDQDDAEMSSQWLSLADQATLITRLSLEAGKLRPDGQCLVVSDGETVWAGRLERDRLAVKPVSREGFLEVLP
jgi:hypothetical protein